MITEQELIELKNEAINAQHCDWLSAITFVQVIDALLSEIRAHASTKIELNALRERIST